MREPDYTSIVPTPKVSDGIPMRGTLCVTVKDAKTGAVIRRVEKRNKITYLAADLLIELICQRSTDPTALGDAIYSMRMGTSTVQPQRSDTNLGAFVIGKTIGDAGKVNGAVGEVTFIATLEAADGNGNTLSEAGLFTGGSAFSTSDSPGTTPGTTRLFAHQIYSGIPKTSLVTVDYSWTISFVASP
jgi:hypothetical protein